jgi:hypothetical protein
MSERDVDRLLYKALQEDTDEKHGQHILDAVADHAERRGTEDDPVLQLLRKAHQARAEPPGGPDAA